MSPIISLILSTEFGLTNVISPFGSSLIRSAFRILLIIFPDLVLGRSGTKNILFGLAVGPILTSTYFLNFVSNFSDGDPFFSTTNAIGTCPFILSGIGTTATSPTAGLSWIAFSTSAVASLCPATFITSSVLPVILIRPFSKYAPSLVSYIVLNFFQYVSTYFLWFLYIPWSIPGANGLFCAKNPCLPFGIGFPLSSTMTCVMPGKLFPDIVGTNGPIPGNVLINVPPVSVCHHVSITGHLPPPILLKYHIHDSLSIGSPTDPRIFSDDRSYFLIHF